jgi:A/G-specific adenine glycosylase
MAMRSDPKHFTRALSRWGRSHRRSFPWRVTGDPFRVLVAEVLLQRSRGRTVAGVYERLFERWPSADELARARVDSIAAVIRPLGLVRRATTLRSLGRAVTELGGVPRTLEGLLELPGVGPYAANATLAVGFGQRVAVVDAVSARVYRRYFGLEGTIPASVDRALWDLVEEVTPRRTVLEWNWAVLDLAATICLPKVPKCDECPLKAHCAWALRSRSMSEQRARVSPRITGS